jgi:crotonobetainyl-CoA:carnitine CoA-transferase CaiB-like acyl-CoA transferase
MGGPLDGVRILDLTVWLQSLGTSMLGDMGAEVIKLEDFPQGDPARGLQELRTGFDIGESPVNPLIQVTSRSKKSIAINLRLPGALDIVCRLAKGCDVFVSNLRPRSLNKWGLNYPALKAANPRIIYVMDSAWGANGPDKDLPGMDLAVQARGGIMGMMVTEENAPPPPWAVSGLADKVGALQLAYAIMLALFTREKTGIGQEVHVSLLGGQVTMGAFFLQQYLLTGREPARPSHTKMPNPLRNTFRTKDGRWISFNLTQADRHWPGLCRSLGLEHLIDDPRFDSMEKRRERSEELVAILDEAFLVRTKDEWVKVFPDYELVFGAVQNYTELAHDPQMIANDYITTIDHPAMAPMKVAGIPVKLYDTHGKIQDPAPELGQHTEEVLQEVVDYTWEEIGRFKEEGIIV